MNREMTFDRFGWRVWFTLAMVVNAGAMLPQVAKLIETQDSSGVAPAMFWIYLGTQLASMLEGFRVRSRILFWGMLVSASITSLTLVLVYTHAKT